MAISDKYMQVSYWAMLYLTGLLLAAAAGGCQKNETAVAGSIALTPPADWELRSGRWRKW